MAAPLYIPTNRALIYPHSHHLKYSGLLIVAFQCFQFSFSSIAQSFLTLCDPMDCSTPNFPIHHQLPELAQTHVHQVGDAIQPLLLLPSIFPSIRVFSNELALCIRWPKSWSFSFSISPSNEYSGLIFFRIIGLISLQPRSSHECYPTP